MRWVVGDVQGCALELDDLLREVRFDPGGDELWSVGDLINRGPDSLAALGLWRDVGGRAVIGNHEVYALLAHSGRRTRRPDTLAALFDSPEADRWFERLRGLPALVRLAGPDGVADAWIVHAGLDPRWGDLEATARELNDAEHDDDWLESPGVASATRLRCCSPDGERASHSGPAGACPPPARPWDAYYCGPTLVVHGHWAARGHYRGKRTLGLDSGCVYGGSLTAWCQEEDRIVQIPSRASGRGPRRVDLGGRRPADDQGRNR